MTQPTAGSPPAVAARPSAMAFAVTLLALGILGAVRGKFSALWSGVPATLPGRVELAYLCAFVAVLTGLGLLWRRTALVAARVLVASFALWLLFFRLPVIVVAPTSTGAWWGSGETAVLLATAWTLAVWGADADARRRLPLVDGEMGLRIARTLFGLALIPFGIAHFTYLERTVSMVPGWLPAHLPIAVLTGSAFIVAGVAMIAGVYARLAATLVALQVVGFTLLVWIPIMAAQPTPSDWAEFISSCMLTVSAWVVADSYRGRRWLAVGEQLAPAAA